MADTTRLNVNMPTALFKELKLFAKEAHLSVTVLIRVGLPILVDLIKEVQKGNTIQVVNPNNDTVKEVLLPR